ncbi:MAG: outer membrane lipoprotein chaperone LolA [Gammaproteobacteria bacterium]|nr:outer membrane lipoprotein chaperone LolA [Gammaproteobacteria bacterium]MDD9958633.1 outer membrane lipoprotein chaperone LolA [Gammaproteobacteria bacterium]
MPRIVTSIVALTLLPPALGQETAIDELGSLLTGIDTLSAEVLQLIVESDGGVLEQSEIQMHLKKPDGFYWETIDPFPELIVTNGELLWNYQPDLEQVVIENWDNRDSELAAQLLNGRTENLADEYTVELISDNQLANFILSPTALDSVYEQITIRFVATDLDVIHLDNKNGEQTVWEFSNIEKNHSLADSLFEFEPPEGIDIIANTDN